MTKKNSLTKVLLGFLLVSLIFLLNIPTKSSASEVNLLPGFKDSRWTIHPNARITGTTVMGGHTINDVLDLYPTGAWQNSEIIQPVQGSKVYKFSVNNPFGGTVYVFERDKSGKETWLATSTDKIVQLTLKVKSHTKELRIGLSNGDNSTDRVRFYAPTLTMYENNETTTKANILPNFFDKRWNVNADAKLDAFNQRKLELNATGVWKNTEIIQPVVAGKEYIFRANNPSNGTIYIYERNKAGKESLLTATSDTTIFQTFKVKSSTKTLRIGLSNGTTPTGKFEFSYVVLTEKANADLTPPVITVDPEHIDYKVNRLCLLCFSNFNPDRFVKDGVKAHDDVDGDLTLDIIANYGETPFYSEGNHTIDYKVTDKSGNTATAKRTITTSSN